MKDAAYTAAMDAMAGELLAAGTTNSFRGIQPVSLSRKSLLYYGYKAAANARNGMDGQHSYAAHQEYKRIAANALNTLIRRGVAAGAARGCYYHVENEQVAQKARAEVLVAEHEQVAEKAARDLEALMDLLIAAGNITDPVERANATQDLGRLIGNAIRYAPKVGG